MADKKKKTEEVKDAKEEKKLKEAEAAEKEKTAAETASDKPAAEERQLSESTENKRRKKAERREAKAARKAANIVEEKKKRPNNLVLTILIFGVIIGMFAFVGGYNYFNKPASIEKYLEETGMADMYSSFAVDETSTGTLKAEGNTVKIFVKVPEDAPEDAVKEYKTDEGVEYLKEMGAYFLTTMKPEVRGFTGTVKISVRQGDERLNYVEMSYREAKKFMKEQEEKAEKEAGEGSDSDADADSGAETEEGAEEEAE